MVEFVCVLAFFAIVAVAYAGPCWMMTKEFGRQDGHDAIQEDSSPSIIRIEVFHRVAVRKALEEFLSDDGWNTFINAHPDLSGLPGNKWRERTWGQ